MRKILVRSIALIALILCSVATYTAYQWFQLFAEGLDDREELGVNFSPLTAEEERRDALNDMRLAESGDRVARRALADRYETGRGVERDSRQAAYWLNMAEARTIRGYVAIGAGASGSTIFRFPFGDSVVAGPDGEFEFPDVPPQQGLFTKFVAVLDTSAASLAAKLPTRVQDTVLSSKLREEAINKVMTDRSREDPDFDPQQYLDHRNTPVGQRAFESLKAKAEAMKEKLKSAKELLFSYDMGEAKMHITPLTDAVVRLAVAEKTGCASDDCLIAGAVSKEAIERAQSGLRTMGGAGAPPFPITSSDFVPNPEVSFYDRYLEATRIKVSNDKVVLSDIKGKVMASASIDRVMKNDLEGDAMKITEKESIDSLALVLVSQAKKHRDSFGTIRISPDQVTVQETTTYTVTGRNLVDGMSFHIPNCTGMRELPGGTATQRRYSCKQEAVGYVVGFFRDKDGGTALEAFSVTALSAEDAARKARERQAPAPQASARPAPAPQAPALQEQRPSDSGSGSNDNSATEILNAIGTIFSVIDTVQKIQDATRKNNTPPTPTYSPQPNTSSQATGNGIPSNTYRPAARVYCNDGSGRSYQRGVEQEPRGCHCLANVNAPGVTCRP